jgi:hypothetical protein
VPLLLDLTPIPLYHQILKTFSLFLSHFIDNANLIFPSFQTTPSSDILAQVQTTTDEAAMEAKQVVSDETKKSFLTNFLTAPNFLAIV